MGCSISRSAKQEQGQQQLKEIVSEARYQRLWARREQTLHDVNEMGREEIKAEILLDTTLYGETISA